MENKTASQVASQVVDKYQHRRQNAVGKAQATILTALGIDIDGLNGNGHAQQIFDELGIVVSSKRVGRRSVPVVSVLMVEAGEDTFSNSDGIDLSAISEYMI